MEELNTQGLPWQIIEMGADENLVALKIVRRH